MIRGRAGIVMNMSVTPMANWSKRPPVYPLVIPTVLPISTAMAVAATPTANEIPAPTANCSHTERPRLSVPRR